MTDVLEFENTENAEQNKESNEVETFESGLNINENNATVIAEDNTIVSDVANNIVENVIKEAEKIVEEEVKYEPETFEFGADINQLLTLIINTFIQIRIFLKNLFQIQAMH